MPAAVAAPARLAEVVGHEQLLDPALDQGLRAWRPARRRPGWPVAVGVRSRVDRGGLAPALDLALDVERGVADLGQAGADADVDAAAQPLAQVGVQRGLEGAGDARRARRR